MGSVNISLKKEAYEFLKSLKSKDQSFSEVILEFKGQKSNREKILELFNEKRDLSGIDWQEKGRRMKATRERVAKRIGETREYMEQARKEKLEK